MQIFRSLAGYSLGKADVVRRAMAKKKRSVMEQEREAFIYGASDENGKIICDGCVNRGISAEAAERIFDSMSDFSSYAFNKSHAAAYAFVAYQTAYLKRHYPAEYFASLLTSVLDNGYKLSLYIVECKKIGLKILPPSVNESNENFTAVSGGIRFGLLAVRNLGKSLAERIIGERERNGKYISAYDFCFRNNSRELNRKAIEGLIKSGAMDGLADNRRQLLYNLDKLMRVVENESRIAVHGQLDLFGAAGEKTEFSFPEISEMSHFQLLAFEKEATGLYLSGHPMDEYQYIYNNGGIVKCIEFNSRKYKDGKRIAVAGVLEDIHIKQLKNGNIMASTVISDTTGEASIIIFSDCYSRCRSVLQSGAMAVIYGKVSEREDRNIELICEKAEMLPLPSQIKKKQIKPGLYLRVLSLSAVTMKTVKQLLGENPGASSVIIFCSDTGKRFSASCAVNSDLLKSLTEILGEENVKNIE